MTQWVTKRQQVVVICLVVVLLAAVDVGAGPVTTSPALAPPGGSPIKVSEFVVDHKHMLEIARPAGQKDFYVPEDYRALISSHVQSLSKHDPNVHTTIPVAKLIASSYVADNNNQKRFFFAFAGRALMAIISAAATAVFNAGCLIYDQTQSATIKGIAACHIAATVFPTLATFGGSFLYSYFAYTSAHHITTELTMGAISVAQATVSSRIAWSPHAESILLTWHKKAEGIDPHPHTGLTAYDELISMFQPIKFTLHNRTGVTWKETDGNGRIRKHTAIQLETQNDIKQKRELCEGATSGNGKPAEEWCEEGQGRGPSNVYYGYDFYGNEGQAYQLSQLGEESNAFAFGESAGLYLYQHNAWDACLCTQDGNGAWTSTGAWQLTWNHGNYNGYSPCWNANCDGA